MTGVQTCALPICKTIEHEGLDVATRDFIAGMTDRYAVRLYEQLYIPKPWAID